ncbi:hypothetical protein DWV00_03320 [Trinickia dinghuensis]|uniref:Uncharacterized protein n=1 Tax=Trinickia dinghuensis TaxID=2291023 RepID=A0A3D8K6F3_9BURK|nr:hypothetical protein DWV00_03320 [Trinickia dinghuensis]
MSRSCPALGAWDSRSDPSAIERRLLMICWVVLSNVNHLVKQKLAMRFQTAFGVSVFPYGGPRTANSRKAAFDLSARIVRSHE